jgi:hypothetical protein
VHSCGALSFDTVTRMFSYAGNALALTPREHAVLETLITRSGRAVSKEKLFDEVFSLGDDANLDAIDLYIHRVRKSSTSKARRRRHHHAARHRLSAAAAPAVGPGPHGRCCSPRTPSARAPRPGSLRGQLLRWLLGPLLVLVALNTISVYRNALDAADVAYDRSLLASTRALAERVSVVDGKVVADVPYVALDSFETDTLGRIYYKVTGIAGETVSGYADLPPVPANVPRSEAYPALVRFYHANYNGQPVRIAALLQPVYDDSMRGIALIQVGETLEARRAVQPDPVRHPAVASLAAGRRGAAGVVCRAAGAAAADAPENRRRNARLNDASDVDPALVHKEVRPLVAAMNSSRAHAHADQQPAPLHRRRLAPAAHAADRAEDPGRTGAARMRPAATREPRCCARSCAAWRPPPTPPSTWPTAC